MIELLFLCAFIAAITLPALLGRDKKNHQALSDKSANTSSVRDIRTQPSPEANQGQKRAGQLSEQRVVHQLKKWSGVVHDVISTGTVYHHDRYFQCDALVMLTNGELVLLEVKYFAGRVYCSGDAEWVQTRTCGQQVLHKNACNQVERSRALLTNLLRSNNLLTREQRITTAVVFSHAKANIAIEHNPSPINGNVVHLNGLQTWLGMQLGHRTINDLDKKRFARIKALVESREVEFGAA